MWRGGRWRGQSDHRGRRRRSREIRGEVKFKQLLPDHTLSLDSVQLLMLLFLFFHLRLLFSFLDLFFLL